VPLRISTRMILGLSHARCLHLSLSLASFLHVRKLCPIWPQRLQVRFFLGLGEGRASESRTLGSFVDFSFSCN
jgi:hypothetical protein